LGKIHCTASKMKGNPPWGSGGAEEETSRIRKRRREEEETRLGNQEGRS
jgi:hypothetical protein